jgi:hypothetical protein
MPYQWWSTVWRVEGMMRRNRMLLFLGDSEGDCIEEVWYEVWYVIDAMSQ